MRGRKMMTRARREVHVLQSMQAPALEAGS
jgi:hypothetical protein